MALAQDPSDRLLPRGDRAIWIALILVFVLANVALRLAPVGADDLIEADALTFYRMAQQLLETGTFAQQTRQPLYPILIAATHALGGPEHWDDLIVLVQIAMLAATGVVAWLIARPWLQGSAVVVFGLVILNPNAVGVAHWPLADTLHALLFAVAIWALLIYGRDRKLRHAIVCGAVTSLAGLTRPESALLIYLLPLALPVIALSYGGGLRTLRRSLPGGVLALAVAILVAAPWALHIQRVEGAFATTGGGKGAQIALGNYAATLSDRTGETQLEVLLRLNAAEGEVLRSAGLANASAPQQRAFLSRYYLAGLLEAGPATLTRLYALQWVAQFASGGAQSVNRLLGGIIERDDKLMSESGRLAAFFGAFPGELPLQITVTIACVAFAIIARLLGLVGLVAMIALRHWPLLLVIVGSVGFKALVHLFYATSRYRLSLEPLLMILAVYGWEFLRARWGKRYSRARRAGGAGAVLR